jgi:hypothetical protein
METTRRPKERAPQTGTSRGCGTSSPGHEPRQATSAKRIDESCPLRYYPLFALATRRRTPIRYY